MVTTLAAAFLFTAQPALVTEQVAGRARYYKRIKKKQPREIAPPVIVEVEPKKVRTIRIVPSFDERWSGE